MHVWVKHDEDCTRKSDKQKPMGRLTKRGTLEKWNYVENTAVEQWQIIFYAHKSQTCHSTSSSEIVCIPKKYVSLLHTTLSGLAGLVATKTAKAADSCNPYFWDRLASILGNTFFVE